MLRRMPHEGSILRAMSKYFGDAQQPLQVVVGGNGLERIGRQAVKPAPAGGSALL